MKVLLVDDSSTMRRIQKTQLASIGLTDVTEAGNGAQAFEILNADPSFDYILLDWNMPEMDGLVFLNLVRANDGFNKIKIVMCTSEADKGKVMEAVKAGANNYIVKPFTPDTLKKMFSM